MKRIFSTLATFAFFLGAVCPAYAGGDAEKFGSIVLWIFSAYCALIVVFQVFTAAGTLKRRLRKRALKRDAVR